MIDMCMQAIRTKLDGELTYNDIEDSSNLLKLLRIIFTAAYESKLQCCPYFTIHVAHNRRTKPMYRRITHHDDYMKSC